jgi:hypothetical protein
MGWRVARISKQHLTAATSFLMVRATMAAKIRFALVAGLAAAVGLFAHAQTTPARTSGKVLILDNERALEGDIELQGEQYCIRRGDGEMAMPAKKAICLCASWDEALAFLKSRANLADADERLRLAQWCQDHGLLEQGLAEVTVALDLRPGFAAAKQLQSFLAKGIAAKSLPQTPAPPPVDLPPPPAIDLSTESLALFTSKVQPILMNTCAKCHVNDQAKKFQLFHYEGGQRTTLQRNLAAALGQINLDKPYVSPLLMRSVSVHWDRDKYPGAVYAPLQGRNSVPFRTLESWVQMVVANNPHLLEEYNAAMGRGVEPRALPRHVHDAPPLVPRDQPAPNHGVDVKQIFQEAWQGRVTETDVGRKAATVKPDVDGPSGPTLPPQVPVATHQETRTPLPLPEAPRINEPAAPRVLPQAVTSQAPLSAPATAIHTGIPQAPAVERPSENLPALPASASPVGNGEPGEPRAVPITPSVNPPAPTTQTASPVSQRPGADDPYDPDAFNRVMHPNR